MADLSDMSLGDSALQADADLDDVARKIAFLNLGFSFGGRIHVDSKLEGTSDVAKATSTVRVNALRLTGLGGRDLGPIDLTLDEAGTVDLRPGGRSTLESFRLVSGLIDAEARAEATDATDAAKAAGRASFSVKAYPAAIQEKLGDFLAGYEISGSDLLVSGTARKSDRKMEPPMAPALTRRWKAAVLTRSCVIPAFRAEGLDRGHHGRGGYGGRQLYLPLDRQYPV